MNHKHDKPKRTFITCSHLIDCTGQDVISPATLTIEDGHIVDISQECATGVAHEELYDFSGCTIIPGFIDCHDHLAQDLEQEVAGTVRYESDADLALRGAKNARVLLESGITTLRNLGDRNPVGVALRDAIAAGRILGPRMFVSGASICRTGGHSWTGQSIEADGVDDVVRAVRRNLKLGVDCIKLMITSGFATLPTRAEMRESEVRAGIEEAHNWGRKVAVHCYGGEAADWAIAHDADSLEHAGLLEDDQLQKMAEKGIFMVITTGIGKWCKDSPLLPIEAREKIREIVEVRIPDTLRRAHRAGVKVAIGGDINHGMPSDEIVSLVDAGYSALESLRCATVAGAELIGVEGNVGTLEKDKVADLVVLAGNPIQDISVASQVRAVIKAGECISISPSEGKHGTNRMHT